MPFRLCNTLGTFTRGLGNDVQPMYKEFPANCFKHYMDNCLIATREGELDLHRKMVHKMLEIFEEKSYFLKPSKCEFKKEEVDFQRLQRKSLIMPMWIPCTDLLSNRTMVPNL
jgi:hypothetical protein